MDLGPLQALWSQASTSNSYEISKARSSVLPLPCVRADGGLYQKPELSFFDTAQKFAHVLGTGSAFGSLLQTYPLENESAEIPLTNATLQKDEVEDVYLTPGGSTSNFGALEGDLPETLMDMPLSFDNREIEDQEWLYSLHDTSTFDITGDMQNMDHSNDALSLPTEIRTDTTWCKEIDSFLNVPLTDAITMELSPAAFSGSGFKTSDDLQFYSDMFSTGQRFEDIIDGCGLVAQPVQSDQTALNVQDLWLPDPITTISESADNLNIHDDYTPSATTVSSVVPSITSASSPASSSSPTSVLEAILKKPTDTDLPPTPEAHTPQSKGSKGSMLLFGKHESEIIAKLKGVKKTEKRSMRNKLVAMPVEEFNSMLEQSQLSEIEVAFMKEWRRRGKNKTAAQFARKKRKEEMSELDIEVDQLKRQNKEMLERYEKLRATVATYKNKTLQLESELFKRHSTVVSGISRDMHNLHSQSGGVLLTQRTESNAPIHVQ